MNQKERGKKGILGMLEDHYLNNLSYGANLCERYMNTDFSSTRSIRITYFCTVVWLLFSYSCSFPCLWNLLFYLVFWSKGFCCFSCFFFTSWFLLIFWVGVWYDILNLFDIGIWCAMRSSVFSECDACWLSAEVNPGKRTLI